MSIKRYLPPTLEFKPRAFAICAVQIVLIALCWYVLSGRVLDLSQTTFVYRDF